MMPFEASGVADEAMDVVQKSITSAHDAKREVL